jgi:YYY domain-containing protein
MLDLLVQAGCLIIVNSSDMPEWIVWAAVVELLGLAALPLLRAAFGNRRDAALLSRLTGLAMTAWLAWAMTLLPRIPFERRTLWIAAGLVALASWVVNRRAVAAKSEAAIGKFWGPEETRGAIWFWAPALVFLFIRACLPEILGQEKFMDLAFVNSIARNKGMPPLDPWMAGRTINYYYWGYLLAASLVRMAAVVTTVGYNLAVATFAGFSFSAAGCLGFRLSGGRPRAALLSGFAAVFAGNLAGAFDAWKAPFGRGFDYWHASRVIGAGKTIDEFPFFTFFHADLHPHLLAFPYFLAAFAVATRVLELPSRPPGQSPQGWRDRLVEWWPPVLLAFLAGTARAANNWLLPAIAILIVGVSVLRVGAPARIPKNATDAVWGAIRGGAILLVSLALWWPYSTSYSLLRPKDGTSVLAATTMNSELGEFLLFWALLLVPLFVALVFLAPSRSAGGEAEARRRDFDVALLGGASVALALTTSTSVLLVLVPLGWLALTSAWRSLKAPEADPAGVATSLMLVLGLSMVAGCEFVYFRDSYGLDLQRMNTVFKFYNQAWPLIGIAAAVLAERAWTALGDPGPRPRSRLAVRTLLAACLVLSVLYPLDAALSRWRMHEGAWTLDAFPALNRRSPGDAAAIAWLGTHAPLGSIVLEASGDPYSEFARVSSHTGIPTVMGWANHEGLWRNNEQEVADRAALVKAFYSGLDERVASLFLQRYGVTHVVLGEMERSHYPGADRVSDFIFLTPVFPESGRSFPGMTVVYEVHTARPPAGAVPPPSSAPPPLPSR